MTVDVKLINEQGVSYPVHHHADSTLAVWYFQQFFYVLRVGNNIDLNQEQT